MLIAASRHVLIFEDVSIDALKVECVGICVSDVVRQVQHRSLALVDWDEQVAFDVVVSVVVEEEGEGVAPGVEFGSVLGGEVDPQGKTGRADGVEVAQDEGDDADQLDVFDGRCHDAVLACGGGDDDAG
jgi:hypothetical protein